MSVTRPDDFTDAPWFGRGVALCPRAMIRGDLEAGRLRQLSDISVMEEAGYYVLRSEERIFKDWKIVQSDALWSSRTK